MHPTGPSARSFKCTCTRKFTQENAYTKHQRSCVKGKKRLFSALSKAKELLGSAKWARLDARVSMESSSMQLHCPQPLSLPSDHANEALSAESSNIDPALSAGNVFGFVHQYFSSTPPLSHDPEEAITLQDISVIPPVVPANLGGLAEPYNPFYPYPNQSSFKLGHWYWNGTVQKSHQSFKELLDIVGCPDFDPGDVEHTHWDKINLQLGASVDDEGGDEWEDEDAASRIWGGHAFYRCIWQSPIKILLHDMSIYFMIIQYTRMSKLALIVNTLQAN
ncbi:hypothetical protein CY34DRAFT_99660 [Suillus luteus UH-Slu-Lm8-n1]|uniref:Uncharacterized protein n=1 Tax=Suillus luteus UH-Slu-Lm8-n1 TaxID=930992 RepID=A0A0C9Z7A7_9AGAM|nr:hypothetical protein CY34DRAFT_99660 [Suillus luteus UH-Slu-Lm8-n1]